MNYYKIYFGDRPFYITNHLNGELMELVKKDGTLMLNQPDTILLTKGINDIESKTAVVIVLTNDVAGKFEELKKRFTFIEAGGGLVRNDLEQYLFIFRRGKWDLPKGKLDDGEAIETCAIREVNEETGLSNVSISKFLLHTWHVYHGFGQHVLKQTSWYDMFVLSGQTASPQLEEDIEQVNWLPKDAWEPVLENTYPSVVDVLELA